MKNLKSRKLYFQVYDALRDYIIQNNLRPGDRMPTEAQLTEALGVSRNVLREGVKTLEIIGVVTSKPGVGMVLNSFNSNFLSSCIFLNLIADDIDLAMDSQQVRRKLELGFSRQSFDTMTDEKIGELEVIVRKMSEEDAKSRSSFYELDSAFHAVLLSGVNNQVLKAFIDSAWAVDKYFRSEEEYDKSLRLRKHQMIIDALKKHDYQAYLDALNYHFDYQFKDTLKQEA